MFAIAAVSQSWGIGKDNRLLFHISADMKRFRALTLDKTVLMGRRTLESMPGGKGLPHRRNIVLTSNPAYTAQGAETVLNPVQALFTAGEDAAVIGGESVYRRFLPLCQRVYITKVFADAEADAFFPDLDADPRWQVERESEIFEENGLRYQFVDYIPRTEERSETELPPERDEPAPFAPEMDFSDLTGIL